MKHLKTKEVAERLGYSVEHFRKSIKLAPDFPKAKRIKLAGGGESHPFWTEEQIAEYLKRIAA